MKKLYGLFLYTLYRISLFLFKKNTLLYTDKLYGKFSQLKDYQKHSFELTNESQCFYGEISKLIGEIKDKSLNNILLPGENDISKKEIQFGLKKMIGNSKVYSIGLSNGVDFKRDFEEEIPKDIGKFSLIISQAMVEHLMDPYKHMKDLSNMLEVGGYLIVHTVMPGFPYHRHPIDTIRFYPDWFEEIAAKKRCNLKIIKKYRREFHIFYMYKKI